MRVCVFVRNHVCVYIYLEEGGCSHAREVHGRTHVGFSDSIHFYIKKREEEADMNQ